MQNSSILLPAWNKTTIWYKTTIVRIFSLIIAELLPNKIFDNGTFSLKNKIIPTDHNLQQFLKGVIWDMDGVLIDSMEIHFKIWEQVFSEYNAGFARKDFNRHFGTTNLETIQKVLGNKLSFKESCDLAERKQLLFEKQAVTEAQLIPGVDQWLQYFFDSNIPQAVASSNAQRFIEAVAENKNISRFFQALVSAEGLASKPDPAVFLESARLINAKPDFCLVFEDAVAGVEGAKRAGMKCIAITTTNPATALNKADLIIPSFSALTQTQLLELVAFK
jgi:beta-phosphoglucomutase-like phosphatase (HAD superfamily)